MDLKAVYSGMAIVAQADKVLRELLAGRYDGPVGNVHTVTQAEFLRQAPMAQPYPGQAVRHGITPDGDGLGYQADREPAPGETRQGVMFCLALSQDELELTHWLEGRRRQPFCAQRVLQCAANGLLYAGSDPARSPGMRRHMQSVRALTNRDGVMAVERLLSATVEADG